MKSGAENTPFFEEDYVSSNGRVALSEVTSTSTRTEGTAVTTSSTGVNVVFTITADATVTLTSVTTKLESAVTAGTFTTALVSAGYTSASGRN